MYLNRDRTFLSAIVTLRIAALEQVSVSKTLLVTMMTTQSVYLHICRNYNCIFVYDVYNYPAPKAFKYCTDFYFIYCYMILKEIYRPH